MRLLSLIAATLILGAQTMFADSARGFCKSKSRVCGRALSGCDGRLRSSRPRWRIEPSALLQSRQRLVSPRRSCARHSQLRTGSCPRSASCRGQGKFGTRARSGARSRAGAAMAGSVSIRDQSSRLYMDRGGRVLGRALFTGAVFVPPLGGKSCRDALRICSLRRRGLCALQHRKWEPRSVARNCSREKRRGTTGHGRQCEHRSRAPARERDHFVEHTRRLELRRFA